VVGAAARRMPTYSVGQPLSYQKSYKSYSQSLDKSRYVCYIVTMKRVKARVNKDGLMGSKSRVHRVKKGKGSFRRRKKHQKIA